MKTNIPWTGNRIDGIKTDLNSHGYSIVDDIERDHFEILLCELGSVFDTTYVQHEPSSRAKLCSTLSMPLHTDHYAADLVAWVCLSPADLGGETMLLDFEKLVHCINETDKGVLSNIYIKAPIKRSNVWCDSYYPLLSKHGIYFADWLLPKPMTDAQTSAVCKLLALFSASEKKTILLKKNQGLIVDNSRILHGRMGFTESSFRRQFVRYYVSSTSCDLFAR